MKKWLYQIAGLLLVSLLTGCATGKPETPAACKGTMEGDSLVLTDSSLQVQLCNVGQKATQDRKNCISDGSRGRSDSWYEAMRQAKQNTLLGHTDWRLPTKGELSLLHSCGVIAKDSYLWSSSPASSPEYAIRMARGELKEEIAGATTGTAALLVRAGRPQAIREAQTAWDDRVVPYQKKQQVLMQQMEATQTRRQAEIRARDEAGKKWMVTAPKGTQLNCSTGDEVHAPSASATGQFYECPRIGYVSFGELSKNRWKMTSIERIPTMTTAGERGVVLSIMIEKQ